MKTCNGYAESGIAFAEPLPSLEPDMSERYTIEKALQLVADSSDKAYGVLLSHGTLEIGYYRPDAVDPQQPHTQDEVYIVQSGSGCFSSLNARMTIEVVGVGSAIMSSGSPTPPAGVAGPNIRMASRNERGASRADDGFRSSRIPRHDRGE